MNENNLKGGSFKEPPFVCKECGKFFILSYGAKYHRIRRNQGFNLCAHCQQALNAKNTFQEKYRVTNISQLQSVKEQKVKTSMKNHNTPYFMITKKSRLKTQKKLGVKNISQLQYVKDKKKETNQKNWGVDNVFQNSNIKEKSKNTLIKKYNV
jgi:hypothetical protein